MNLTMPHKLKFNCSSQELSSPVADNLYASNYMRKTSFTYVENEVKPADSRS